MSIHADPVAIREALKEVMDPELGFNIVDLGLVYRIECAPERLFVEMTLTSPACPMGPMIENDALATLSRFAPKEAIDLQVTFTPPWTPGRMSPRAKEHFQLDD